MDYRDNDKQPRTLFKYWIIVVISLLLSSMVVDAQSCQPFNIADIHRDVTDDMMHIYDLYYLHGDEEQANALFKEWFAQYFIRFQAIYRTDANLWLFVMKYNDRAGGKFFVYVGDDWTTGSDGALHGPCGIYILSRFKRHEWELVR